MLKTTGAVLATATAAGVGAAQDDNAVAETFSGYLMNAGQIGEAHYFTPQENADVDISLTVNATRQATWQLLLTYDGTKPEPDGLFRDGNYDEQKNTISFAGSWTIDQEHISPGQEIGIRPLCQAGPGNYTIDVSQKGESSNTPSNPDTGNDDENSSDSGFWDWFF
jgi:uncharacterized protein YdbL (DUF1318 family)